MTGSKSLALDPTASYNEDQTSGRSPWRLHLDSNVANLRNGIKRNFPREEEWKTSSNLQGRVIFFIIKRTHQIRMIYSLKVAENLIQLVFLVPYAAEFKTSKSGLCCLLVVQKQWYTVQPHKAKPHDKTAQRSILQYFLFCVLISNVNEKIAGREGRMRLLLLFFCRGHS